MSKKLLVVLSFISLTAACATAVKSARDFSNIKLPPMEGTACQVHSDCPQGSACMHQVCVNMVHVACQSDLNCPEYEKCFDGVCKACGSDSDCSKDFQCNTNGVCVPKNTAVKHCNAASDCQNGEVCINGLCASFCYGINDQKGANKSTCLSQNNLYVGIDTNQMACSVSTSYEDKDLLEYSCDNHGVCLNNACYEVQCTEDSQCGDGKKCIKGECYKPECNDDSECYWGKKCIDYFCQECTQDSECSDNEKCLNQPEYSTIVYHQDGSMSGKISSIRQGKSCLQCTNDSHCGGDRPHCNLDNFKCVACFNNSGCSAGEVCDDGLCRPECTQNNQCSSGICVDQVCYECNDNSDCNENDDDEKFCKLVTYKNGYSCSGKTCNYTRLEKPKKICTACAQDSDCSDGLVCGGSGVCVECFADRP